MDLTPPYRNAGITPRAKSSSVRLASQLAIPPKLTCIDGSTSP
jgi:hypothetical protein